MTTKIEIDGKNVPAYEILPGQSVTYATALLSYMLKKIGSPFVKKYIEITSVVDESGTSVRVEYDKDTLFVLTFEHEKTQTVFDKWGLYIYDMNTKDLVLTEASEYRDFKMAVVDTANQILFAFLFDEVDQISQEDPEFSPDDPLESSLKRNLMH